jgi:Putative transposase
MRTARNSSLRTTKASRCTPASTCTRTTGRAWLTCAGYGARPPLTQERLSALPDGKLAYRMKRRLGDGRDVLILEPRELIRRLATLVPPPRAQLVRYHGVFGPAPKWRKEIAPESPPRACRVALSDPSDAAPPHQRESKPSRPLDSRIPWSEVLLRLFREGILVCTRGGRRKVIAFIDERPVIERILGHLGLLTTGPPTAPAHLPALADGSF